MGLLEGGQLGGELCVVGGELAGRRGVTGGGGQRVVRLDDLAEPLRSAASALRPGDVSGVVEAGGSYIVLKRER